MRRLGYEYFCRCPELEFFLLRPDENGQVRTLPMIVVVTSTFPPTKQAMSARRWWNALQDLGIELRRRNPTKAPSASTKLTSGMVRLLKLPMRQSTFKYTLKAVRSKQRFARHFHAQADIWHSRLPACTYTRASTS